MADCIKESLVCQLQCEHKELDSSPGLPFRELLSAERIARVLELANVTYRERIFSPMVTIWACLSQVVSGKFSACGDAVAQ